MRALGTVLVTIALFLAALKITGKIALSWWLITAPIWFPALVFLIGAVGMSVIMYRMEQKRINKNKEATWKK